MGLEERLGRLEDAVLQLTAQMRELTDIYIGAIEVGNLSKLTPIAVKIRNKRLDKKNKKRDYSMEDARSYFSDYHRSLGEKKSKQLLKGFNIGTVSHLAPEDINRFIYVIKTTIEN